MNQLSTVSTTRVQYRRPFRRRSLVETGVGRHVDRAGHAGAGAGGVVSAAIIKIVSPGPVFFQQERVGYRGRRFMCFKFRTMQVNSSTALHQEHLEDLMASNRPMSKLDMQDPRVIPGGIWLRALGLDELPQLINVFRGDMSLVGPRPCVGYEYEKYLPRHRGRCATLPGLTGLWQVNDKNNTTFEEMIELDLKYVRTQSLGLDISILLRTLPAVIHQTYQVRRKKREAVNQKSATEAAAAQSVKESSFPRTSV